MWKLINSPIVILILALILMPIVLKLSSVCVVNSIFNTTQKQIVEIAKEEKDDGLKNLISSLISQIIDGISEPFEKSMDERKIEELGDLDVYKKISVTDVNKAYVSWGSHEKVVGKINNNSDKTIKSIHLNFSYYSEEGLLIDVEEEWANNIKFILPGQSASFEQTRC